MGAIGNFCNRIFLALNRALTGLVKLQCIFNPLQFLENRYIHVVEFSFSLLCLLIPLIRSLYKMRKLDPWCCSVVFFSRLYICFNSDFVLFLYYTRETPFLDKNAFFYYRKAGYWISEWNCPCK